MMTVFRGVGAALVKPKLPLWCDRSYRQQLHAGRFLEIRPGPNALRSFSQIVAMGIRKSSPVAERYVRLLWVGIDRLAAFIEQTAGGAGLEVRRFAALDQALECLPEHGSALICVSHTVCGALNEAVAAIRAAAPTARVAVHAPRLSPEAEADLDLLGARLVRTLETRSDVENLLSMAAPTPVPTRTPEPWRDILIGQSAPIQRVAQIIRLVARRRSTVLITGETGTGKEVVARAIHIASDRASKPFVAVNCCAIPQNLLEAELFGHTKGAFTGATQARQGRFEQANGGTIFLDEIGDLPLDMQAKLLRVLQERECQPLGGAAPVPLDVRVISATNADLESAVKARTFRQDLFYRLNVVPLRLPPLAHRRSDVPLLAKHFIEKLCRNEDLPAKEISAAALVWLERQPWPGNVRQLEHAVETAIVLSGDSPRLDVGDFATSDAGELVPPASHLLQVPDHGIDFDQTVSSLEFSLLSQALRKCGGNKAKAAEMLQLKRTTLLAKIKALESTGFSIGEAALA
jgi:DNA-binding NtrC family response regulator